MPLIGRTCARAPGIWRGPIVIKGVLTAGDARQAIGEGADAIVVSNHGGRQLDGLPNTLKALPEVVAAVEGRAEVLSDGAIRRGADIVKVSPVRADSESLRRSSSCVPMTSARSRCSAVRQLPRWIVRM